MTAFAKQVHFEDEQFLPTSAPWPASECWNANFVHSYKQCSKAATWGRAIVWCDKYALHKGISCSFLIKGNSFQDMGGDQNDVAAGPKQPRS
jgi:hypothetical protein